MPTVFHGSATYLSPSPRPVVTIGNFDGVHLGHRVLLGRAVELARQADVPACAFTFDPAPRDVLRPGNPIRRIQTLEDRIASLGSVGIDHVIVEPFTLDYAKRTAGWFASEVLTQRLGATSVVVGWDFRFGKGREGHADALRELLTVPVEQIEAQELAESVVSSSRIRRSLDAGDVAVAGSLLGRPHDVVGAVVHGDGRGSGIGFPTANVEALTPLLPGGGVYAVRVLVDGQSFGGMANIGTKPTFGDNPLGLEVNLFDFAGDLYGRIVRVQFLRRLRGERTFESIQALVAQLTQDRAEALDVLEMV